MYKNISICRAALTLFVGAFFVCQAGAVVEKGVENAVPALYTKPVFRPDQIVTVSGTATGILSLTPQDSVIEQVYLFLKSDSGTLVVHVGPRWYVESQEVQIITGDRVTVTGSNVIAHNRHMIIAVEIKKGPRTLALRTRNGHPVWDEQ